MSREPLARRAASLLLYALFALTGVGLVLPGTLLPFLVPAEDGRSGLLFFFFFVGTSLGAFCARGMLGRMLGLATLATALPVALLPYLQDWLLVGAMLLSGFGLGLAMTAISLLRSRRMPSRRAAELTRLNLVWAAGAACAPVVLLRGMALIGVHATVAGYAGATLLTGCAASALSWKESVPAQGKWRAWRHFLRLPGVFAITLPLATGIEAGVGAWLVTYTLRTPAAHQALVTSGSSLWAGVLLSRLLSSTASRWATGARAIGLCAILLVFGQLLLAFGATTPSLVAGAFFTGFGVGPLYPWLLAELLDRTEAGNAGFLVAGAGSALLPLWIGQISQHTHSLRDGLGVPLVGSMVMLGMLLRMLQTNAKPTSVG